MRFPPSLEWSWPISIESTFANFIPEGIEYKSCIGNVGSVRLRGLNLQIVVGVFVVPVGVLGFVDDAPFLLGALISAQRTKKGTRFHSEKIAVHVKIKDRKTTPLKFDYDMD